MRKCWVLLILLAAPVWADGHGSAGKALADIEALYAKWRTAVESSDIAGYVGVLDPEVRLLPPGGPAIDGADRYGEFLKPVFATATYDITVDVAPEILVWGDTAIVQYDYTIDLNRKDPNVGVDEPGALTASRTSARYFDVVRKRPDGQWRVWRHSWQEKAPASD